LRILFPRALGSALTVLALIVVSSGASSGWPSSGSDGVSSGVGAGLGVFFASGRVDVTSLSLPSTQKFGIQKSFPHVRSLSGELLAVRLFKYTSSSMSFFAHLFSESHTQKSSSVPSSSQSTASSACSPSACNLSNPVSTSRKPVSLNALNSIAKPCVS